MILGIGTDLIEVKRVKVACDKEGFIDYVYTDFEQKEVAGRLLVYAGYFAAKEAVSKALGTGISGFGLKDIEIYHNKAGKPYARLYGGAKKRFLELGGKVIHLSITDTDDYAFAFAIVEN